MKKVTKKIYIGLAFMCLLAINPGVLFAEEVTFSNIEPNIYQIDETRKGQENDLADISLDTQKAMFEKKLPNDREDLTDEEKDVVNYIENYFDKHINLEQRVLSESLINNTFVGLAFNIGFKRNNFIFSTLNAVTGNNSDTDILNWYDNLPNKEEKSLTVYDIPTQKNILLYSRYINNNSDTTVVVHHGYRSKSDDLLHQAKYFSEQGYNVLIPDARSHGKSEGEYITFGNYEREDLNKWIESEAPDKKIILYGVSMGAATVMMSQEVPQKNVIAVIEDCGYDTAEQQFRDILRFVEQYVQYVPVINQFDWNGKENQLLELLNDNHLKPVLKMDLFNISPRNSVSLSGLPKLFIHGSGDWFINPVAMDRLYESSLGYKEKLTIPYAGHAEAFFTGGAAYKEKVEKFLEKVGEIKTKKAVVAADVNLLKNPSFEFNSTGFVNWQHKTGNRTFDSFNLSRNNYQEFVLGKDSIDTETATQANKGIRFFNRYAYSQAMLGQDVPVIEGESYSLNFNVANQSIGNGNTYPNVRYSIDGKETAENLKELKTIKKELPYSAFESASIKIGIGAGVAYQSWLDNNYTHTYINNVSFINTDQVPPKEVDIKELFIENRAIIVAGMGEPHTSIQFVDNDGNIILEVPTDNDGSFSAELSAQDQSLIHIINKDIKGNLSNSTLIIL